jgi:hypothetical protein
MVPTIVRSDSSQGYSDTITSYQNDSTFNYKIIATNRPTQYTASPLPSGLKLNAQTGLISGAPRDTGVTTATITAANASGISPNFTLVIHIIAAAILTVPTVLRSDGSQGNSDTITCYQNDSTFNYKIVATGGPLQYTASPLPKGLKLNSQTGVITGAPKDTGITRVTIKAANGNRVSSGFILIIHSIAVKIPNILRSDGTKGISDSIIGFLGDSTFNYTIIATGGPLQYTVSPLPKGLKLNSQTGVITGAPQDTGFTSLSITAVNADGVSPIFTLLIHVIPISVPNIASPQFTYAIIGRPFYYKISVSSKSDGFFASNLPIGLSLDNASGVISGTISSLSTIVSALSAKNNKGSSGDFLLKTVVIDVGNAGNHTPLPSGGDYIDTLSMSDTSLQGIGISLSAGPGDSAPKLLPNALSVIKTNTNSAIRISISSSLFNDVTGFRAKLIIRDSLKADTILLSRPIIRDHANCDDVFTQSLSWVPLSVTALPDSPAARQKLSSLFSDKGEYDKQKCRLLQWIASSGNSASLAEFGTLPDSLFNFKPGRLFWMKAVDSVPISFGKATTVALNDTFPITLSPNNWTDFSLPFLFPVMLSDIFSATQTKTGINYGDSLEFYHWKKSGISYSTEPLYLSRLSGLNSSEQTISGGVGKAFSIFNPYSNPVTLYFPPTCSAQTLVELKKKTSRPSHNQSAWSVKVKCHDDLGNVLADIYCGGDETLPGPIYYPVPPSFLSKSIQIMDSIHGKYHGAMVTNSKVNQGAIFSLLLSNNSDRWTTLSVAVESFINLPYNNKAVLIDLSASQAYINDKLSVSLGKGASQTIYLGVGTSTYISTMKNTISMAPGLRSMYPNPFRNFLCVQYVVPFKIIEGITFSLTDLQGKCIWSKTQQNPQSGIHELRINLDTKENTRLAAGIYLLRYSIIDNQKSVVMFHKRVFCM